MSKVAGFKKPIGQVPMTREVRCEQTGKTVPKNQNPKDNGWMITYDDGSTSWSKRVDS